MSYLKTKGIVIREVSTGEADKIITIFSKSNGRISAAARGARRPKSAFSAGTQLLSYCDYVLYSGREMYSINSSDVIESFYDIRNDVVRLTYAAHFIDIITDTIKENQPAPKVLQLLLNSLHMLAKTDKSPELIARIFEIRLLSIVGYAPYVNSCIICGSEELESCSFSFQKCGFICNRESCIANDRFAMQITSGTAKAIQYIVYTKIDHLFSFNLSQQVLDELGRVARRYMRERLEKDYNKLDFLKNIQI